MRRGMAGGQQHAIGLPRRHPQHLAEPQHQAGAGAGPAGLDEAEMPGGDAGLQRQVHLAQPPGAAGAGQQGARPVAAVPWLF